LDYKLPVLAVKSVETSRRFYCGILSQSVTLDLGKNVTFSGGFCVQEDFAEITRVHPSSVQHKSHNMELYFETANFDQFLRKLEQYGDVQYVHPPKLENWQQRVVRIYDPDGHMIEIGESMRTVAQRFLSLGYTVEETATIIQHPISFVDNCR
jgi:catechol 2,3-dioxygenase-like lactoylglutathione lyase family enzyme